MTPAAAGHLVSGCGLSEARSAISTPPFACTAGDFPWVSQTILVVDDDLAACQVACRSLRDAGLECVWANTGEHAMALLVERNEAPVLFVFDVRLTDMPGPTLAWLLSERYGGVPVLFISGYPSFDAALLRATRWTSSRSPSLRTAWSPPCGGCSPSPRCERDRPPDRPGRSRLG